MGSVMGHRMIANLEGTTDPAFVELARNPDSIVHEATRRALSPEAVTWLQGALADSFQGVFITGILIGAAALLLSLAFPAGSPEELASQYTK